MALPATVWIVLLFPHVFASPIPAREFRDERTRMGCRFEIVVVDEDELHARAAIDKAYAEIDRIEQLISSWRPESQTYQINQAAGLHPVKVSDELFQLCQRSLKIARWTDGAFDFTMAGMHGIWRFQGENLVPPSQEAIEKARHLVNFRMVELNADQRTVFLKAPRMRIGFGANGKGYAANRAAQVLKAEGIDNALIDAGGDLLVLGHDAHNAPWRVGIRHPRAPGMLIMELRMSDKAVVTSGDYEQFFIHDHKRFAHILDPRTGWPATSLSSVTILCPDAELADGLATAVFVMGMPSGLDFVNQLKGVEAILIDPDLNVLVSKGIDRKIIHHIANPQGAQ